MDFYSHSPLLVANGMPVIIREVKDCIAITCKMSGNFRIRNEAWMKTFPASLCSAGLPNKCFRPGIDISQLQLRNHTFLHHFCARQSTLVTFSARG